MTSTIDTHPALTRLAEIETAVDDLAVFSPALWDETTQAEALLRLSRLQTKITATKLRLMAGADRVAAADGHRSIAAWLTRQTRARDTGLRREHRLAKALDQKWTVLGAAVIDGRVNLDQAQVVTAVLDKLPEDELTPEQIARAEVFLVDQCAHLSLADLEKTCRHLVEVIAPDRAHELEGNQLAHQERQALETCRLSFSDNGDGITSFRGKMPTATCTRLQEYLHSFTNPRQRGVDPDRDRAEGVSGIGPDGQRISYPVRLGQALINLIERIDPATLPDHGGDATRIIVTIDYHQLVSQLGYATTSTGNRISAGQARRLACQAGIIPAVLGGKSQVLDLGRSRRLFTPAQRTALQITHHHCAADGCTIPTRWCEIHHQQPWSHGGRTDLKDAAPLCSHHHHLAHDPGYTATRTPAGAWAFHRRQ